MSNKNDDVKVENHGSMHSSTLKGHQKEVYCLYYDKNQSQHQLWSGSEDCTARLWDGRRKGASLCLMAPGPVMSIVTGRNNETSDCSEFGHEYNVYLSIENKVFSYDLRYCATPIVMSPTNEIGPLKCEDEINQLGFWCSGSRSITSSKRIQGKGRSRGKQATRTNSQQESYSILATADDVGCVKFSKTKQGQYEQPYSPATSLLHNEQAMVTTIAFSPRTNTIKQLILASGGTDNCIQLWSVAQQTRACTINIPVIQDNSATPLCNPPMVHSLVWSPSGQWLSGGLGDGSIVICDRNGNIASRIVDAHNGPVASVEYFQIANGQDNTITAHDRCLVSVGNDGHVVWWDLGTALAGETAIDPGLYFKSNNANSKRTELSQPETIGAVAHKHKPNFMVTSSTRSSTDASTVFIADTSNVITVYSLPIS